jgi:ATP-binding cassette subfamily B protein
MVLLTAGIFVLNQTLRPAAAMLADALGRRANGRLRERLMRATLGPSGIAHLEDPTLLDQVTTAQSLGTSGVTVREAVSALATVATAWAGGVLSAAVLARFRWWLPPIAMAFYLVLFRGLSNGLGGAVRTLETQAQESRRSQYFVDLALAPPAAKEIRIFGLGEWVTGRFDEWWALAMTATRAGRRRFAAGGLAGAAGLFVIEALMLSVIGRAAARGELTLGQLTTFASAALGVGALLHIGSENLHIAQGTAPVAALLRLERDIERHAVSGTLDAAGMPSASIRFEGVHFTYPGQDREIFSGLDLTIEAGRSLAIVGDNGAGKTTFVKLLARLYDPTAGSITVDGVDLRQLDPARWQRRVAAIFQDFARYQLPASDNVAFGALHLAGDHGALARAAERAGAVDLVEGLPAGWDTVLSRQFSGGIDPSGGQWQRIALARAFFAVEGGADVLVLDEPTANLDVRAEADLYDRFLDLTRGLTTIVISHRFSTVRRAERIVVLEHGIVVEDGTHDELVEHRGRYARMFSLQAARFTEDDLPEGDLAEHEDG